jgi:hypothetical protein
VCGDGVTSAMVEPGSSAVALYDYTATVSATDQLSQPGLERMMSCQRRPVDLSHKKNCLCERHRHSTPAHRHHILPSIRSTNCARASRALAIAYVSSFPCSALRCCDPSMLRRDTKNENELSIKAQGERTPHHQPQKRCQAINTACCVSHRVARASLCALLPAKILTSLRTLSK